MTSLVPAALKFPALVRARAFVKENQITKYSLPICAMNESFERHKTIDRTQHEQRQLKNAASATILSLKTLVKEKNRELAKADERLQDVRRSSLREVDADRTKIKGLTDKSFQDHGVAIDRLRDATSGIEKTQNQAGISFRISKNEREFAARPSDIEKTCEGLEKKLKESNAAREQAENRCSKALCELEQQKADIITLAAQLQEASSGGGGLNMLDKENQIEGKKLLNSLFKEGDRLRGLKGALVKLKTQFVAAEEAHAAALAQSACANQPNGGEKTAYLHNKIAQLTQEIQIIRSEAMATRCDIGTAWSQRDKYKQQLERTLVQVDQLRSDAHTYESRCRDLDDSLARARDECNKLRVIEEELRIKLRGDARNCPSRGPVSEVDILRAQNIALRETCLEKPSTISHEQTDRTKRRKIHAKLRQTLAHMNHIVGHQSLRIRQLQLYLRQHQVT